MLKAGAEELGSGDCEEWLNCHGIRREADGLFAGGK